MKNWCKEKFKKFEIIWDILHKTEGFERVECEDYINVRLSEENAKGEYWGFRNMLIHKSDLITLDSNNFRERIFGTIARLAEIDNAVYDDSLKK